MKKEDYHNSITVSVPVKTAFEKITLVSEWWTKSFEGSSENPGDTFSVRFGKTFVDFKTIEVIPRKKIIWQVTDCNLDWIEDKTEWKGTKLIWEISEEKGKTAINMTHEGLVPEAECYNDCRKGWNFYVEKSLYKLLTEDKGLPDRG